MFASWVAHGAEIGTVAFFALAVFLMFCAAILAVLGLGSKLLEGHDDESKTYGGPRPV
jgi:hypothetical protein